MVYDFSLYDYNLPEELIAKEPAKPRDFSRLFIYSVKEDKILFDKFFNLDKYLSKDCFLVFNNTKVLPSRIEMIKETGGKIKILFLINEIIYSRINKIRGIVDRKLEVGQKVYFPEKKKFLIAISQEKNIFTFEINFDFQEFLKLLNTYGEAPLPPYLKKTPLTKQEAKKKYQTIFAKKEGSVAAPTASFHFTQRVLNKLKKKKIKHFFVTLHVGLGTFSPVTEKNIKKKKLHQEYWEINEDVYQQILKLKKNKKLIAVGTTTTRLLETIARKKLKFKNKKAIGTTELFIFPPFEFKLVDGLITNFHLPKSSLMMLVEAFLQFKNSKRHLKELYEIAIKNKFRFYSFGDAMLII
ncbi:S-adenosylmethionine:tRNA ribosyltransferase-isomerase [bacterium HR35]|nr:S-adenosylmethionine:tRNA ribosyltransferase-isomerase [bacterium HR35]